MSLPQIVIVGRPNVGKSSLFNWLAGRRLAIVDNVAGVTRDRMTYLMQWRDRYFEIVDTGGIGVNDVDDLTDEIEQQIAVAIDSADLILFVVDTREGILPLDQEVARRLRHINKPIVLVANKTDESHMDHDADQFYQLGRGKLVPVSTLQNRNKEDLLNVIADRLPDAIEGEETGEPEMKIAVVGRRNVGKSTFVNTLARAERMIVSEVAGTTRDSVDIRFELDGKSFTAIDTPGLRRRASVKTDIDFYSTHRAERSIRRADVVLMFFDASQQVSKVDKQLISYIAENYKPVIFVVNKWDLYHDKMPTDRWATYLHDTFRNIPYAPVAFITGQTGKNVKALLNHAQMLFKQSLERITTGELNRIVRFAIEKTPPPLYKLRRPKIYFATQIGAQPPTIVLKCNSPKAFSDGYRRYLLSMIRDHVSFSEVPIKLYLHRRQDADFKGGAPSGEIEDLQDSDLDSDSDLGSDSGSGDAAIGDMLNEMKDE